MSSTYLFDTNAFINWFEHYGVDIVEGLDIKIKDLIISQRLISVREVFREIKVKTDNVAEWAKKNSDLFLDPSDEVVGQMFYVMEKYSHLINAFKPKPQSDPWIIAQAIVFCEKKGVDSLTVVVNDSRLMSALTEEGIAVLDLKGFMRAEGISFKVVR